MAILKDAEFSLSDSTFAGSFEMPAGGAGFLVCEASNSRITVSGTSIITSMKLSIPRFSVIAGRVHSPSKPLSITDLVLNSKIEMTGTEQSSFNIISNVAEVGSTTISNVKWSNTIVIPAFTSNPNDMKYDNC